MDAFGIVILVFLIVIALGIILRMRGKKFKFNLPKSAILDPDDYAGAKDLNNELINYYHTVLNKYIDYYRKLNQPDRRKFINRLHELIENMEFIGEQGQSINLRVCILCCAPLIQITMGLDTYLFNNFHTFVVYPRQFYSEKQKTYVKGGVSRGDAIFFSLEDLIKGYNIPNDALNLGLHEIAHAIHIEYFDEVFEQKFPQWLKIAEEELVAMRYKADPILRNYAGRNKHELFAVCVETFFEQSMEMKNQQPKLYEAMCFLLNQDPLKI